MTNEMQSLGANSKVELVDQLAEAREEIISLEKEKQSLQHHLDALTHFREEHHKLLRWFEQNAPEVDNAPAFSGRESAVDTAIRLLSLSLETGRTLSNLFARHWGPVSISIPERLRGMHDITAIIIVSDRIIYLKHEDGSRDLIGMASDEPYKHILVEALKGFYGLQSDSVYHEDPNERAVAGS